MIITTLVQLTEYLLKVGGETISPHSLSGHKVVARKVHIRTIASNLIRMIHKTLAAVL